MKKLIILIFLISNNISAQKISKGEEIMEKVCNNLIHPNYGTSIKFNYFFENESYKMTTPINGELSLFTENRFHLEFNSDENKIIQIYNGEQLFTIIPQEKEIQIDTMENNKDFFIQNILSNYKNDFNTYIKEKKDGIVTIELLPKKKYNEYNFNQCIDKLNLPNCLKLPNQCKIGINSKMEKVTEFNIGLV